MRALTNTEYRFRTLPKKTHLNLVHHGLYQALLRKECSLAVVGLGYVGLPIALEFAKDFKVVGYDISQERITMMQEGKDPSHELSMTQVQGKDIEFTSSLEQLRDARAYIVAVPTPVDESNEPDLRPLKAATQQVAECLKRGDYVIFESTVYPGCTEEICLPILETVSGLEIGKDFKLGYSPERINPGDKLNTLKSIVKVVSGNDDESTEEIANLYRHIVHAGVHMASSIRVAEASKIVENTQRDVNIALMNELSVLFTKMGISTEEVLEAASTKWNFLSFRPGLVGGHCIGVDPFYLLHKARKMEVDMDVVKSSRMMNDWLPFHLANRIKAMLESQGKSLQGSAILLEGVSFKPNVADVRNSKVIDLKMALELRGAEVHIADPVASAEQLEKDHKITLVSAPAAIYDLVVLAVGHGAFSKNAQDHTALIKENEVAMLLDIPGHCTARNVFDGIYEAL